MHSSNSKLGQVWYYMRGHRLQYIGSILLMNLNTVLQYVGPMVSAWTIDGIIRKETIDAPDFVLDLIEKVGGTGYLAQNLWICGIVLVLCTALRGIVGYYRVKLTDTATEYTVQNIKNELYNHLQNLPYEYHVKAETGDLIQRCTTDVETVRRFLSGQLMQLFRGIAILVFAVLILGGINPILTLLSFILMPGVILFSYLYHKKISNQFKVCDEADGAMSTVLQENLTGVRVVRAFARQRFEREKYHKVIQKLFDANEKLNGMFAFFWSFSDLMAMAQQTLTLFAAMYFVIEKAMSYGYFYLFNSYIGMIIWPLRQLGRVLSDAAKMRIAMGRINDVLTVQDEYVDETPENTQKPPIDRDIVFSDVSFSYGSHKVLDRVSFTAKRGQTIAILGPTGSGKSSLVQLLQRLYDNQSGTISIGGVDIRKIDRHYLREHVGIVLQEPFLYSRTIRENIGITQKNASMEQITQAAQIASVHDVIESFDKGYDTVVGERGVTLSGGQKQRVAIARTLLRHNDVLIFDDSLSAVDTETDAKIRDALEETCKDTTTFIISHRVSTLQSADCILVLENGKIVQSGTHEELIRQEGMYQRIFAIQSMTAAESGKEMA